ncbi:transcriptional regulator TbsP [Haloarchaeobius sp. HRN-SO-5]|uniref:transcriptional regulator TbsP n=1 Tax=Haloarchaeobius sp. HRN-SO-5 TaxID=3446118 RepID=UPI003EBA3BB2
MSSNLLDRQIDDILHTVLEDATGDVLVVNPSSDAIEEFVRVATRFEGDLPTVHMLADERTLKDVMDDFIVASNAADLVDRGELELRTVEQTPENSLLVTEDTVVALVTAGNRVGGLTTDDGEFVTTAYDAYTSEWEAAEPFKLRTPPISRVRETLESDIGPQAEADFTTILDSLETARGDGEGLDEVTISLLVAAKNEALLYDISKWGEDVGIASKATFSRTKTKLEDMGLIDTEKVPIDVGRPRLRLKIGDDRLREADNGQLASVAQSILN